MSENRHADLGSKIAQKEADPPINKQQKPTTIKPSPIWTSTKQSMSYVTVAGIQSDTSWQEQDWPKESTKELISNANDSINDNYPTGTKITNKIHVRIKIDSLPEDQHNKRIIIRIAVRNSNIDDIPVFEDLPPIFDYTSFVSTKRHQHKISSGALGDFLKRSLGMGYASWTNGYNRENSLTANDKQWPEPVIFRHNGQEQKVFLHVDWDNQAYWPVFSDPVDYNAPDFTEVEIALPIDSTRNDYWRDNVNWHLKQIEKYIRNTKIAKTDIDLLSVWKDWRRADLRL
jgi:hypothetical protein